MVDFVHDFEIKVNAWQSIPQELNIRKVWNLIELRIIANVLSQEIFSFTVPRPETILGLKQISMQHLTQEQKLLMK